MNRRKAKLVADFIESGKYKLRMRHIFEKEKSDDGTNYHVYDAIVEGGNPPCKTAACIAGQVCLMKLKEFHKSGSDDPTRFAAKYLELDGFEAYDLFTPSGYTEPTTVSRKNRALEVLRGKRKLDSNWFRNDPNYSED